MKEYMISSGEPDLNFVIKAREIEPTEEEKSVKFGRDMLTVEEYCSTYGWMNRWMQTTEVIEDPPEITEDEDQDFVPVLDGILIYGMEVCKAGSRFSVFTDDSHSWIDNGDWCCSVEVEEIPEPLDRGAWMYLDNLVDVLRDMRKPDPEGLEQKVTLEDLSELMNVGRYEEEDDA